jgi:triosephosphate isomerase
MADPAGQVLLVGNWKMNGGPQDIESLARVMAEPRPPGVRLVACPPAPLISHMVAALRGTAAEVGAQDCHFAARGAYTGDLSPSLVAQLGAHFVILGHSERRCGHGETNELIRQKLQAAWEAGLHPLLCVGENLAERQVGQALSVVKRQLAATLSDTPASAPVTVAYEPVWAIGSGLTPSDPDVVQMCVFIRDWLARIKRRSFAVLYGGSASPENAARLLSLEGVDGLLVGGASIKPAEWRRMIEIAAGERVFR